MTDKKRSEEITRDKVEAIKELALLCEAEKKGLPAFRLGEPSIGLSDDDALAAAFGTESGTLAKHLSLHLSRIASPHRGIDANCQENDDRQFAAFAVAEIKPRDAVESMLAVQMAGLHTATVSMMSYLALADNVDHIATFERALGRLQARYTASMEALRKHRTGGQQTVTVQHVNVEGGGQAIVGNVQTGGGT